MKIITKVAKGVAYGDVSNQAVRNVLTEISKSIKGTFTEQEMLDTLKHFDWKCPYTGRDLKKSIENGDGTYATDHIYPQNKEWCGLNVKGNLVIVDREANLAKKSLDVETFLLENKNFFGNLDMKTRQERLDKIKQFQRECGYDPEEVRKIVSPLMIEQYEHIKEEQQKCLAKSLDALSGIGMYTAPVIAPAIKTDDVSKTTKTTVKSSTPAKKVGKIELVFYPSNEQQFKEELLKTKRAHFVLTYEMGIVKTTTWNADRFLPTSGLRANVETKSFWRNGKKEGLIKVEAYVDYK